MVALYVSVGSLIALLFSYIDYAFPDPLTEGYYDPYSGPIRFAMATLVIVFPLYIFFTRVVHQDLRRDPMKREGAFRRWLIFITLFVAGAMVAGDLIALINTYLSGEITGRFVLKISVIFALAGGVFVYYWFELKGLWEAKEKESKLIGAMVSLAVIGSIVGGFFIIGSPMYQRDLRFDRERVSHLERLQSGIENYWQNKRELPAELRALEDPLYGFVVPYDPETGEVYSYAKTSALSFELCAVFTLPSEERTAETLPRAIVYGPAFWVHGAGRTCFERTVDPDFLYPRPMDKYIPEIEG